VIWLAWDQDQIALGCCSWISLVSDSHDGSVWLEERITWKVRGELLAWPIWFLTPIHDGHSLLVGNFLCDPISDAWRHCSVIAGHLGFFSCRHARISYLKLVSVYLIGSQPSRERVTFQTVPAQKSFLLRPHSIYVHSHPSIHIH
jgi:hypothetical protein